LHSWICCHHDDDDDDDDDDEDDNGDDDEYDNFYGTITQHMPLQGYLVMHC